MNFLLSANQKFRLMGFAMYQKTIFFSSIELELYVGQVILARSERQLNFFFNKTISLTQNNFYPVSWIKINLP